MSFFSLIFFLIFDFLGKMLMKFWFIRKIHNYKQTNKINIEKV
jgi:hypothetical protein